MQELELKQNKLDLERKKLEFDKFKTKMLKNGNCFKP
jgi:hypothetical protein